VILFQLLLASGLAAGAGEDFQLPPEAAGLVSQARETGRQIQERRQASVPAPVPLRELMEARGRLIGAAADADALKSEPDYARVLSSQFGMLTPENAMKFDAVHPRPGQGPESYDFSQADALVSFARAHRMLVRGHTLVWHRALPAWAQGSFTPARRREILQNHIETVVGHFRGQVYCWDVVNEALDDGGRLRRTVWSSLGPDYIADAFGWAHGADPGAKLFYNEYVSEDSPAKTEALFELLKELKARGVPIDGVGFQMHLTATRRHGDFGALLHRFASLGLEIHITELDVSSVYLDTVIRSALGSANGSGESAVQAQVYGRALESCLSEPACKAFVLWGFTDKHSWLPAFQPLIFDSDYRAKPAFDVLENILRGAPR